LTNRGDKAVLELDKVSVYYGDVQVIFELSLRVEQGEIVTLIGSNGAGKTTTVNAISGVLRPRGGQIRFLGKSLENTAAHQLVAQGLVQVPEGRMLFPALTVKENLVMGSYPRDARSRKAERMDWVFELFPRLRERHRQLVRTLSGGEQQMLAIGRGLMAYPKLLILDEPSIGLAPMMVAEMFRVIQEINKAGTSILLIEQNAVQALGLAHRGYVLEHGHLTHHGIARELLGNEAIRSAYLGI
jgi:branched-chain amino acid transport system ATP-binding protein